ncbi:N-acetylmuramoyl-L-alanine amidase [Peribacillus kribbensis]|uniref:N-acetylmuramoyl-L-alanine amidase n=1 Tax=Peribacillus kribbensis TaxID=356658 RepID=UPI00041689C9|nr:N-acetylmuramoyl-L-alanine amidase [Peribacillus kribbensis]
MKRKGMRAAKLALFCVLAGSCFFLSPNSQSVGGIAYAAAETTAGDNHTIQESFKKAALEFSVPENILLAVSYNLTRWDQHKGLPSTSGGYGIMHLTQFTPEASSKGDNENPEPISYASSHTLDEAASILKLSPEVLKTDPAQNIRGAAALLASYAKETTGRLSADEADWYGAAARYSGSDIEEIATDFADQVYASIQKGEERQTAEGQDVVLAPTASIPNKNTVKKIHLKKQKKSDTEVPKNVPSQFIPAFYQQLSSNPGNYTNYDVADRPKFGPDIRYIVIHDTEVGYDDTLKLFSRSYTASAHYVVRSSDGFVTQMIKNKDVAWHAGNWYFNMHSIGIEHEGFALQGGSWFTEQMYRNSASLVRYLARIYQIPLDRAHIIGHEEVPGLTPANQSAMHSDPATFWDWEHYMELLGAPITDSHGSKKLVTIKPHFKNNEQYVDVEDGNLKKHPSNFVYLHTGPSEDSPIIKDKALPKAGDYEALNWGDKAKAGQTFALAESKGDWDAIWYGGQKAWFYNQNGRMAVRGKAESIITPKKGKGSIPVYGSAYPEAAAYPSDITPKAITPLQYSIPEGQFYPAEKKVKADYYNAKVFTLTPYGVHKMVYGNDEYYPIHFNHRLAFVKASDVDAAAP